MQARLSSCGSLSCAAASIRSDAAARESRYHGPACCASELARRLSFWLQRDPEAPAVVARPTGARHFEHELRQIPALPRLPHTEGLQQIVGRAVVPMLLLDALEDCELVART